MITTIIDDSKINGFGRLGVSGRISRVRWTGFGFSDSFSFAAVVEDFEALRAGVRAEAVFPGLLVLRLASGLG